MYSILLYGPIQSLDALDPTVHVTSITGDDEGNMAVTRCDMSVHVATALRYMSFCSSITCWISFLKKKLVFK